MRHDNCSGVVMDVMIYMKYHISIGEGGQSISTLIHHNNAIKVVPVLKGDILVPETRWWLVHGPDPIIRLDAFV